MSQATNTFSEGLITDLNPLTTPNNVLTDCINGTIITYNGNEFSLQNDLGNVKMDNISFPVGYVPVGMKEYGGVIYVALYSPSDSKCEIGSFPSPKTISFGADAVKNVITISQSDLIDSSLHQSTKLLKPLFEMVDKLSPGDQYKINIVKSGTTTELFNQTSPNRMFKIKYFYQTEDGKIVPVESSDINILESSGDFSYFKGNSSSIILVSYEVEKPTYFNTNITSLSSNSINIAAKGYHPECKVFKGFELKAKYSDEDTYTIKNYELPNGVYNEVVSSATISDIADGKNLDIEITPYSDICYYRDMSVKKTYTQADLASMSSSLNNIFKYYVEDNNLKIDFNFQYDSSNLDLFVEVYDPWSDCSTIKKVDDPTEYGINTVLFDLESIPTTKEMITTRGGIPLSSLSTKTVSTYNLEKYHAIIPTGSTIYVRNSTTLRSNHFYIVRISYVEKLDNGTYNYSYFLKSLYTSGIFNSYYNTTDDFETIQLKLDDAISFGYKLNSDAIILNQNTYGFDNDSQNLLTDGNPYKVSDSTIANTYFYYNRFNNQRKIDLDITYDTKNMFGEFNTSLIKTTSKDEIIADLSNKIKLNYTDDFNYVSKIWSTQSSSNLDLGKTSNTISNDNIIKTGLNYSFLLDYDTYRNTSSLPIHDFRSNISYFESFPIRPTLLTVDDIGSLRPLNYLSDGFVYPSTVYFNNVNRAYYTVPGAIPGTVSIVEYGNFDDDLEELMDIWRNLLNKQNISAYVGNVIKKSYHIAHSTFAEESLDGEKYFLQEEPSVASWKQCLLTIRRTDDKITSFLRVHNINDILEFFNNVYICSLTPKDKHLYYPGTISNINSGTTTYTQSINLNATLDGIGSSLFKFYSAKDNFVSARNFNSTNVLTFTSHLSPLSVVNNQLGSNVNIYPLLTSSNNISNNIDVSISDYSITRGSNPTVNGLITDIANTLSTGLSLATNAINITPPTTHGSLYIKDDKSIKLKKLLEDNNVYAASLTGGSLSNTVINQNNFRIYYSPRDKVIHSGDWDASGNKAKAPNIIDDYIYE